jgi:hypothetical protein
VNLEKVIFGAFVILACTLNFGFFIGDLERVALRSGSGPPRSLFFRWLHQRRSLS